MVIVIVHAILVGQRKKKVDHSHQSCGCMMYSRHSLECNEKSTVLRFSTDAWG